MPKARLKSNTPRLLRREKYPDRYPSILSGRHAFFGELGFGVHSGSKSDFAIILQRGSVLSGELTTSKSFLITGKLYLFAYFCQKCLTLSCPIDTIDFIKCVYFTLIYVCHGGHTRFSAFGKRHVRLCIAQHLSFLRWVIEGWLLSQIQVHVEATFCIELVFLTFLDDLKGNEIMKKLMNLAAVAVAFTLLLAASSQATLVLVSDFDGTTSYNSGGTVAVVADPDDAGNNALELTAASDAHVGFTIADGSVATVFFRLRYTDASGSNPGSNGGFGVTEENWAAASGQGKFAARSHVETIRTFDAPGRRTRSTYYDGWTLTGGLGNMQQSAPDAWQNIWFVLDTTGAVDTYDMWVEGGTYAIPTLVADDAEWYRQQEHNLGIAGLYIYSTGTSPATYIDDVYVDTTGIDLSNPLVAVPEPSSFIFGLMAMAAGVLRPRSRKS